MNALPKSTTESIICPAIEPMGVDLMIVLVKEPNDIGSKYPTFGGGPFFKNCIMLYIVLPESCPYVKTKCLNALFRKSIRSIWFEPAGFASTLPCVSLLYPSNLFSFSFALTIPFFAASPFSTSALASSIFSLLCFSIFNFLLRYRYSKKKRMKFAQSARKSIPAFGLPLPFAFSSLTIFFNSLSNPANPPITLLLTASIIVEIALKMIFLSLP